MSGHQVYGYLWGPLFISLRTHAAAGGGELPAVLDRAREWAADEGYVLTDPSSVRLQWIRAVPCPPREHSHDGWDCDIRRGVFYMPSRASRGAFRGVLAEVSYPARGDQ